MNSSAFPIFESKHGDTDYECVDGGMTMRDYFAARVLSGLPLVHTEDSLASTLQLDVVVRYAYQLADAMLKERLK